MPTSQLPVTWGRSAVVRVAVFTATSASGAVVVAAPPEYSFQSLPVLPGGVVSEAHDVNEQGVVAGASSRDGNEFFTRAVIWQNGQVIELTGNGFAGASAFALNDAGKVGGFSDEIGINAFSWSGGLTPLPVPFECCSAALSVNELDQFVGQARVSADGPVQVAVRWQNGVMLSLGTLGGDGGSAAMDVNDFGIIVGIASSSDLPEGRAFVYYNNIMGALPGLGGRSAAQAINNDGVIVGYANLLPTGSRAVVWTESGMSLLPNQGLANSRANDINNHGDIVGRIGADIATIWHNGELFVLADYVDLPAGWQLVEANAINDRGQIVGRATYQGQTRAFLLSPIGVTDLNGDGVVNVSDLLLLLSAWGSCDGCAADINGDGVVNVSDLLQLLSEWGS